MIHFTCDGCQRRIDTEKENRYVVRLEVYAAVDAESDEEEVDHLEAIDEMLERLDEVSDQELDGGVYQQVCYDLCEQCRAELLKNPLGRITATKLGFSNN